ATAARGNILDASDGILAESRELVRLTVAPGEVRDKPALASALKAAGFSSQWITASTDTRRRWVALPGLHVGSEIGALTALTGVRGYSVMKREYATDGSIRRIVGGIDQNGRGADGIELALDSLLLGDSGKSTVARDSQGRTLDTPGEWSVAPRRGHNVALTISRDLQEICDRVLARATDSLHATGGDIVVMNPFTGEVLAMASRRPGRRALANTAISEPFEPGSTLKPFIAAALLERRRARPDELIDTFGGEMILDGRRIVDEKKTVSLSLADVIRYSSNVGIVRFAERLTPREKFETLRDLGLGVPTGVPLPAEADGTLRDPSRWNRTSPASMVMGYELAVTPLQLVAAYGAIANGGELMEPHLIKEIRSAGGDLVYRARPRVVRRVLSRDVAKDVQQMLVAVVEGGTATRADIATYQIGGKSGTARRTEKGKGYVEGNYTASFVGLFPVNKPQYVVLVKLDSPRGAYYGGEIAAPVTAVVLRAALAAQDAALNRNDLAAAVTVPDADSPGHMTEFAAPAVDDPASSLHASAGSAAITTMPSRSTVAAGERTLQPARRIRLPYSRKVLTESRSFRPVPDVTGLPVRDAVRALHQAGFRVRLIARQSVPTDPAAGSLLPAGSTVRLQHNH
ncbi:MAG: penicillin-binding transpeptidase domain-containing protein, partial [Gemmatimonadaceae bacterium]